MTEEEVIEGSESEDMKIMRDEVKRLETVVGGRKGKLKAVGRWSPPPTNDSRCNTTTKVHTTTIYIILGGTCTLSIGAVRNISYRNITVFAASRWYNHPSACLASRLPLAPPLASRHIALPLPFPPLPSSPLAVHTYMLCDSAQLLVIRPVMQSEWYYACLQHPVFDYV